MSLRHKRLVPTEDGGFRYEREIGGKLAFAIFFAFVIGYLIFS